MKILAIVGSLREKSYNLQLAKKAKELVGDRAEFEILEYRDIPYFSEDLEKNPPEIITSIRNKVDEANGLWIFSPEYNHFFPGVLKNLLDWLSRPIAGRDTPLLKQKPVAISGASPGMSGTGLMQDHLVTMLSFLDMDIMNAPRLTIPNVLNQVDEDGNLKLTESLEFLEGQVSAYLEYLNK